MSHHIEDLIRHWAAKPEDEWVLAVITHVEGSSYRKSGAMMLFHPLGHSVGLISGGCLEADLGRKAQQAMQSQQIVRCQYDASDESDASYQLGCGGIVDLMLVPLTHANQAANLSSLQKLLATEAQGFYLLPLLEHGAPAADFQARVFNHVAAEQVFSVTDFNRAGELILPEPQQLHLTASQSYLVTPVARRKRIAVFGGGIDAQPLVSMALQLGWQVDVVDPRTSYARAHDFAGANLFKCPIDDLPGRFCDQLDAVVVMSHNLDLDAQALRLVCHSEIRYLALLGPGDRRERVLNKAELAYEDIDCFFSAPAGLALGGELPSSIALSILSQCHGVLHDAQLVALDRVMK